MTWRRTLWLLGTVLAVLAVLWYLGGHGTGESPEARFARGLLAPYGADAVRAVEIHFPERVVRLDRRGDSWRLTAPVEDLADSAGVAMMLATLEFQEVDRWLPPLPRDRWGEAGLDAPMPLVVLETDSGRDTLRFGELNPVEKRLWVQASWRDSLALVSTLLRTRFLKGASELRDKRPMAGVPLHRMERLEIDNPRGSFSIVRERDGWAIHRPEPYRASGDAVEVLLSILWRGSVLDFVDLEAERLGVYGLDDPLATVTAHLRGDARPRRLDIGGRRLGLWYARNPDRPSGFLMDSVTVAPLLESFSAYMSVVLFTYLPGQVSRIEGPGGVLVRDAGEDWLWRDEAGREASGAEVVRLLNRMIRISTERVEALLPRRDQLEAWRLTAPDIWRLDFNVDREPLTFELGQAVEGRRYFRRADYPTVYSLPAEQLDFAWPAPADSAVPPAPPADSAGP